MTEPSYAQRRPWWKARRIAAATNKAIGEAIRRPDIDMTDIERDHAAEVAELRARSLSSAVRKLKAGR